MTMAAKRTHGDTWIAKDGRVYVMVVVRANDACSSELLVPMLVATGADATWLPDEIVARFGKDLEIEVRGKDRDERFAPELGPLNPLHANDEGAGVLGMDVLSKLRATIDFKNGLVVS